MVDTGSPRRRNKLPPLAIIVIVLLGLMVLIALGRANGSMRSQDSGTSMPVDTPDEAPVMPPNGQAPTGVNPPSQTAEQPR